MHDTFVPWISTLQYLGLVLDSQLLYKKYWTTVANKATSVLCDIFLLNAHTVQKLILYTVLIRAILLSPLLSAVPHDRPTTSNPELSSQSVSESSVITAEALPIPTCTIL